MYDALTAITVAMIFAEYIQLNQCHSVKRIISSVKSLLVLTYEMDWFQVQFFFNLPTINL